jgi:tRNA modification GTPase
MFSTDDTIVAIATPPGRAGIGVIRLSGPDTEAVARRLLARRARFEPRRATLTRVRDLTTSSPASTSPLAAGPALEGALRPDGDAEIDHRLALLEGAEASGARRSGATTPVRLERSGAGAEADAEADASMASGSGEASGADEAGEGREGATTGRLIDQVVVTFFPKPGSYTGEDVIEISAHGSPVLLRRIVSSAIGAGARLAQPGEFTLRAFVNGRLDLIQAEAVADLVDAVTPAQARQAFDQLEGTVTRAMGRIGESIFDLIVKLEASLDFPEEGYHFIVPAEATETVDATIATIDRLLSAARGGRVIREGRQIAIVGAPNVGKSSLFNALVGADRAIVTDVAGTTRDLLTERVDIEGVPVTFVDTAGLRQTEEIVEREGVSRARSAAQIADLVLIVLDRSRTLSEEDRAFVSASAGTRVIVINKSDLPAAWDEASLEDGGAPRIAVSVKTGAGLESLRHAIFTALVGEERLRDEPGLSNVRHIELLRLAREALQRASASAAVGTPEEMVITDLRDALDALDEITGKRSSEDVLQAIFARFCIGK